MQTRTMLLATMISVASAAVAFADAPRQAATAAKVRCADGTQAKPGKLACKRNGGVLRPGPIAIDKLKPVPARDTTVSRVRPICADGTVSTTTGKGACSRQGGLAPTTSRLGNPVAVCRDGWVTARTHQPATCVDHGGIREWLGG